MLKRVLCVALLTACPSGEGEPPAPPPVWPASDLVAVDVIDDAHVIVVAATGEIHLSSDSGVSWQRAHLPAVAGLRSISMADCDSGWVVGDGVILRTDDGGLRWRRQRLPMPASQVRLLGVSAIDREHAVAVGENGMRLRTEDAGRIWQDVSQRPIDPEERPAPVADVFCDPESKGRCWSAGRAIRRTTDAGRSWQRLEIEDLARIDAIEFGIGQVEVEAFEAERLERFLSANRHRTELEWRLEPGIDARELERIGRRRDPDALFELIDARLQEIRSRIEGAGVQADRIVTDGAPPWDYEDYLDDDPEFLERYWTARGSSKPSVGIRIVDHTTLFSLHVQSRGFCLAVGAAGALLRSDDSGEHWVTAERLSPHDLLAVGFGRRGVIVVGAQGGLWRSEDWGLSWRVPSGRQHTPFFDALRALSFSSDGEFGIIVGEHGRMLRSVDGGATWALLASDH